MKVATAVEFQVKRAMNQQNWKSQRKSSFMTSNAQAEGREVLQSPL